MPESRNFGLSPQTRPNPVIQRKNFLFVVGIDSYLHHPNLSNCVKDAEALVQALTQHYQFDNSAEHLVFLQNQGATREAIWDQLDLLIEKISPHDNLLLYFACHGYWRQSNSTGFLVPYDGNMGSASLISAEGIRGQISRSKAHHVFLMVDACFSGSIFRSTIHPKVDTGAQYAERVDHFASRYGLAAGRIEEVSDGIAGNHSPFSKGLIHYLEHTPDSVFTVGRVIEHIKSVVPANADQTPIGGILDRAGHQDGEFVFRRKGSGPPGQFSTVETVDLKDKITDISFQRPVMESTPQTLEEIQNLLFEEGLDKAAKALFDWANKHKPRQRNDVLHLYGRVNKYYRDIDDGTLTRESIDVSYARLSQAFESIIKRLNR